MDPSISSPVSILWNEEYMIQRLRIPAFSISGRIPIEKEGPRFFTSSFKNKICE